MKKYQCFKCKRIFNEKELDINFMDEYVCPYCSTDKEFYQVKELLK